MRKNGDRGKMNRIEERGMEKEEEKREERENMSKMK